jgi:hypothetical protein
MSNQDHNSNNKTADSGRQKKSSSDNKKIEKGVAMPVPSYKPNKPSPKPKK